MEMDQAHFEEEVLASSTRIKIFGFIQPCMIADLIWRNRLQFV